MEVFIGPRLALPADRFHAPGIRLNDLERAIYSTIAYRDVFDFAPTIDEIHRYLHFVRCTREDAAVALQTDAPLANYVITDGVFFALKHRAQLFPARRKCQILTEQFWPLALKYGAYLSNLPHVRMVALTGTFAARNVRENCDIDFMMVTDKGAMWRTRALGILLSLIHHRFAQKKVCPNYFISMAALTLERKSLYDAQEMTQMVPLFGLETYAELRRANRWTELYLPNALGPPEGSHDRRPPSVALKTAVEWGSNSGLGRMLENFEANRKIHLFNQTNHLKGDWTKSTRETHSLREYVRQDIEDAWRSRLAELDAVDCDNRSN